MFQAQTEIHDTLPTFFFKIQLALALKTRLCVYMYLPYMCVFKPKMYTWLLSWKIETFETVGFIPYLRGNRNSNMSQTPQTGEK